jgi:hypothetical protein
MTGSKGAKADRDWETLSSRQRDILLRVFQADQAAEERERARQRQLDAKSLFPESRPASEWRCLNQDTIRGRRRPRDTDPADFAELESRGLIEIDGRTGMIQLTRAGRAVARAGPAPRRRDRQGACSRNGRGRTSRGCTPPVTAASCSRRIASGGCRSGNTARHGARWCGSGAGRSPTPPRLLLPRVVPGPRHCGASLGEPAESRPGHEPRAGVSPSIAVWMLSRRRAD